MSAAATWRTATTLRTRARGELIVFLNNDTVVQPGWLEALVALARDETVGIVGAKLLGEDGVVQEAGSIVWRDGSGMNYGRGLEADAPEVNYVKEVDYVSGACMLVRASLWREIGGFDSRYSPGYWEDPDLAFEARRRGFKVVYQPQAVVVHYWGVSHGRDVSEGVKRYQVANQKVFADKWRDELERSQLWPSDEFLARDRSQVSEGSSSCSITRFRATTVTREVVSWICTSGCSSTLATTSAS